MATVAHQLLGTMPEAKRTILKAVADNITIFGESLETQMVQLIVNPLVEIGEAGSGAKRILVIDGFDECMINERAHLLQVLRLLTATTPSLLLIIASRPEFDIRTAFDNYAYRSITYPLQLQEYDERSGIRSYLCDEFWRIRESHPAKASIPPSWPGEEVVDLLVWKSSGCYILPSTVIRHVDNPRRIPVALLREITDLLRAQGAAASTVNPLAPLDELYTMILHSPEGDVALIKRILHSLPRLQGMRSSHFRTTTFFDDLFGLEHGATNMALCDLHALVEVSPKYGIVPHHATLHDFLSNQARSKDLFQPRLETFLDLACACVRNLESWARNPTEYLLVQQYARHNILDILDWLLSLLFLSRDSNPFELPQDLLGFDARLVWRCSLVSSDTSNARCVGGLGQVDALVSGFKSLVSTFAFLSIHWGPSQKAHRGFVGCSIVFRRIFLNLHSGSFSQTNEHWLDERQ